MRKLTLVIEIRMLIAEWLLGKAMAVAPFPEGRKLHEAGLRYLEEVAPKHPHAPPPPSIEKQAQWRFGR